MIGDDVAAEKIRVEFELDGEQAARFGFLLVEMNAAERNRWTAGELARSILAAVIADDFEAHESEVH